MVGGKRGNVLRGAQTWVYKRWASPRPGAGLGFGGVQKWLGENVAMYCVGTNLGPTNVRPLRGRGGVGGGGGGRVYKVPLRGRGRVWVLGVQKWLGKTWQCIAWAQTWVLQTLGPRGGGGGKVGGKERRPEAGGGVWVLGVCKKWLGENVAMYCVGTNLGLQTLGLSGGRGAGLGFGGVQKMVGGKRGNVLRGGTNLGYKR